MSDEETPEGEEAPKKKSKLPMIIGVVLLLAGAGGGFFAVSSGLLFGAEEPVEEVAEEEVIPLPDIAFVPLETLTISLNDNGASRHLRFTAQLEVEPGTEEDVLLVVPRIMDVLNGYLRAVESAELQNPSALIRLRTQMLRRIQMVTGEGRVRDLLVMEFVLN